MRKNMPDVAAELADLQALSADMAGYVHSILSAIETLSGMPDNHATIRSLAACGQYVMSSMDGNISNACSHIAEVSKEIH